MDPPLIETSRLCVRRLLNDTIILCMLISSVISLRDYDGSLYDAGSPGI